MDKHWSTDEWNGCYPSSWKGVVVPEAMSHPAKFSSKLVRRMYAHLLEMGWVKAGDTVLDPFGGVALGALEALRNGLRWRGVELEPKFQRVGQGMDCPGIDKDYWRRYHTRGRKWNELNICPDCANLLDGNGRTVEFFGVYKRLIPVQPSHRYLGNIEAWEVRHSHAKGMARLFQGDSRKLLEIVGQEFAGEVSVSSPPYADGAKHTGGEDTNPDKIQGGKLGTYGANYGDTPGQLGEMKSDNFNAALSSPPYKNETEGGGLNVNKPATFRGVLKDGTLSMGTSPGNLGQMEDGNFDAALSSPPYAVTDLRYKKNGLVMEDGNPYYHPYMDGQGEESYGGEPGQLSGMKDDGFQAAISSPPFRHSEGGTPEPKPGGAIDERLYQRHAAGNSAAEGYGATDGQLANMPEGDFQGVVSSPPYEETILSGGGGIANEYRHVYREGQNYGDSGGQLGAESGDDFWLAARQIVEQVYLALEPGGHACWVVKDFVRSKQISPFADQWRQLCEAVGFVTVHEHRAMLVHKKGKSYTLDGETVTHQTESKSFFRRLAEKKGSPRIDWETIWCMEKPR